MGIIYSLGCKECRVWRDLDNMPCVWMNPADAPSNAWKDAKELPENGVFSAYLLATFMADHLRHECILFNDQVDMPEHFGFEKEDVNYWTCSPL